MMSVSNAGGTSPLKAVVSVPMRKASKRPRLSPSIPVPNIKMPRKQKSYEEAVDLLITDYNDKAFIYNSGQVDIIKKGSLKTVKFNSKKDAALYLMKTGWKYV